MTIRKCLGHGQVMPERLVGIIGGRQLGNAEDVGSKAA